MVSKLRRYTLTKSLTALAITAHIGCFSASMGLLTPRIAYCEKTQTFDLDINELRERTIPRTTELNNSKVIQKKRHLSKTDKDSDHSTKNSEHRANTTNLKLETLQPKPLTVIVPSQEKLLLLKALPSPGIIPTPAPSSTITLQNSIPPCELIPKILTITSSLKSISTAEALQGVPLAAPYAVKGNTVLAAIACGLAEAEEITFTRLLASHGSRLINIIGNDSPEAVVNKVIGTLGFSSQTLRATPENVRMIYIFPTDDAKGNGIFVILENVTADKIK